MSDVLTAIGGIVVSDIQGLLSSGAVPRLAETIVADVLGAGGVSGAVAEVTQFVQDQLDTAAGDFSVDEMARALIKPMENAMSPHNGARPGGITAQQQAQMGQGVAQNVNLAFAAAGQAYTDVGTAQAAVELARGTAGEDAARAVRKQAEATFHLALRNLLHAARAQTLETAPSA